MPWVPSVYPKATSTFDYCVTVSEEVRDRYMTLRSGSFLSTLKTQLLCLHTLQRSHLHKMSSISRRERVGGQGGTRPFQSKEYALQQISRTIPKLRLVPCGYGLSLMRTLIGYVPRLAIGGSPWD